MFDGANLTLISDLDQTTPITRSRDFCQEIIKELKKINNKFILISNDSWDTKTL